MNTSMNRRRFIQSLSAASAAFAFGGQSGVARADTNNALIGQAQKEGKLVVYGDLFTVQIIVKGFTAKYPGIDVTTATGDAWQIYNRFIGEQQAGRPVMDAFYQAEDTIITASAAGTLADVSFDDRNALLSLATPDKAKTYIRGNGSLCLFAYNKQAIGSVPIPNDWQDYANPRREWESLVATTNPASSSATFAVIASLYQHFGPENGGAILKGLRKINTELVASMGVMTTKLQTGERPLDFFTNTTAATGLMKQGVPVVLKAPASGTVAQFNAVAISKTAPHPNAARLFLEYSLSAETQTRLAAAGAYPVRKDIAGPAGLPALAGAKLLKLDLPQALKDRDAILKWWSASTGFNTR
ncbi:extracellular solute-binding protein [Burkholderia sp. SR8]|uniref:ABC transporter substrate-binding protein n=1 Tax=Burkholderia sp. SR8 TaxID=3062277 RepID=UPI004064BCFF